MAHLTDDTATALLAYMRRHNLTVQPEFRRAVLRLTLQALMEWEVSAAIHAGHYERIGSRKTYRNGYRERVYQSRLGEITLHIPKLRQGTYSPRFLQAAEPLILDWSQRVFLRDVQGEDIRQIQDSLGLLPVAPDEYERLAIQLNLLRERMNRARIETAYQTLVLNSVAINARQNVQVVTGSRDDGTAELVAIDTGRGSQTDEFMVGLARRGVQAVQVAAPERTYAHTPPMQQMSQIVSPVYVPRFIWDFAGEATLLRFLTQVRNLQQSDIVIAISDLMLPPGGEVTEIAA
jgi:transposase-like protein